MSIYVAKVLATMG